MSDEQEKMIETIEKGEQPDPRSWEPEEELSELEDIVFTFDA